MTLSPTATPRAAPSTSITSPAASIPGVNGNGGLSWYSPRRHQYVGKVDPGGLNGDAHLALRQWRGRKRFETQALGRAEFAADDGFRHQAALDAGLRRCSASRISGIRSLPKYMSVLSTKMVGEPNPPRAITSSVLALS